MKISIKNKRKYQIPNGFTLVELVVVIAGLSTLSAIAIPNILENIKLSKIEEAKAVMNSYISNCLGKYRISTEPQKFYKEESPENLDETKLATLGYKIDDDKSKCEHLKIVPSEEKDTFRYGFDFRMGDNDKTNTIEVLKTGTPASQKTFNSCKGWAGKNCTLSKEKAAEFAAAAALAAKKNDCLSKYSAWKVNNGDGNTTTWDPEAKNCDKVVWLFNGTPVNDQTAYDALVKQKYGTVCQEWKNSLKKAGYISEISDNGIGKGETKDPECNKAYYWFHSGKEFNTQVDWNKYNLEYQGQACNQSKIKAINSNFKGEFTNWPHKIPSPPCNKAIYICNGTEYSSNADYQTTSCATPPTPPPSPPIDKCKGVSVPKLCKFGGWKNTYACRCSPGGIWNK